MLKEWMCWCAGEGVQNIAFSASELADFYFIYLGLNGLVIPLVFTILYYFTFLEPHCHHKASNHPLTSILMHITVICSVCLHIIVFIFGILNI